MKVKELAQARREFAVVAEAWREEVEKHPMKYDYDLARAKMVQLETEVREEVTAEYMKTGEKKFSNGCSIRVRKEFAYMTEQALEWCMEHGMCLTVDNTAFNALCKIDKLRPAFVDEHEVVSPTIPTKLDG